MNRTNSFIKAILLFLYYLFANILICDILELFDINNQMLINFITDILFLIVICFIYKKDIIASIKQFNSKYKLRDKIWKIFKFVLLLAFIMVSYGKIIDLLFKEVSVTDANTDSLYTLANISLLYAMFKTLIFAVIAEELLFKKSIRDLVTNNILFIIISGSIYAFMNIAYTDLSFISIITFIRCFTFSSVLSYIYIKSDDNIFMVMLVKFFYNLIPLLLLLIGA